MSASPWVWFGLVMAGLIATSCRRAEVTGEDGPKLEAEATEAGATEAGDTEAGATEAGDTEAVAGKVEDATIEPFRRQLLELAFKAASKFPSNPHTKNRGQAQEQVLEAAFELGQPLLALGFAPRVEGWRRGLAYADFAYYSAAHGDRTDVARYLALAKQVIAEQKADPNAQEWRADKVRLKVARALAAMGEEAEAGELTAEISPTSTGALDRSWTRTVTSRLPATAAAARLELTQIDQAFESQTLGDQYTSLMRMSGLHGKFFADEGLRQQIEDLVFKHFVKLPAVPRLDAMAPMARAYVMNGDPDGAREVIARMTELLAQFRWRMEDELPELARIAELRVAVGDRDRAKADLAAALERYHDGRDEVVDIYRCETLRPLALAYAVLGEHQQADDLLGLALEEAVENPNSRPRCDDLVATCVAMARASVEPSEALWQRMREICDDLGDPW